MRFPGRSSKTPPSTDPSLDPRVWGRRYGGPHPAWWGLVLIVLLAILSFLAYTKKLPWSDPGYTLTATFENAATLRETAPVRIAGVNVGKVIDVESEGDAAEGHVHRRGRRTADPKRRRGRDPASPLPRRELLPGPAPGQPQRSRAARRRRHPDHADFHRGSARRGLGHPQRAAAPGPPAPPRRLRNSSYLRAYGRGRRRPRTRSSRARLRPSRSTTPSSTAARRGATRRSWPMPCTASARETWRR